MWKAARRNDKATVLFLQRLILRSYSARLLAIRQVSQLNAGKKTAGVDGKKNLSFKDRFQLESVLRAKVSTWNPSKLREIPIPKKNGKTRMLKIPTIKDRAWQHLAKSAIEPYHEAHFHARSYGFRPGRSCWDAQRLIFNNLRSFCFGISKKIVEVDIEKCFDRIDHTALMNRVMAPCELKQGLWRTLKSGVSPEFPDQGTPQGGVISPSLANIALDGIEDSGGSIRRHSNTLHNAGIRYADDMIFICQPEADPKEILSRIKSFLSKLGCKVSKSKTRIVASTDGFDFLGWNFRVKPDGKFKCVPSKDNYINFKKKVKAIVNSSCYGAKVKANKLAPVVRGWRTYHKICDMSGTGHSLWFTQKRAWRVFNKERKQNRYSVNKLIQKAFPSVGYSTNRFSMVQKSRSIYDGDFVYWSKRNSKHYDGPTTKALARQNRLCGLCKLPLIDGESVHLHHVDGDHSNWSHKNLIAVHQSCHQIHHMSKKGTPVGRNPKEILKMFGSRMP